MGVFVSVGVLVGVSVSTGVLVGVPVAVAVAVLVGVGVGPVTVWSKHTSVEPRSCPWTFTWRRMAQIWCSPGPRVKVLPP
ncbi:MAG: hypothetical protein A2148_07435 [Chloroflexi bacterium RBG_16_68_14]|nr:MAG: hypothetical protein A2148_07435 [Chloroflexi bacterium RBG_16_68_14]